MQGILHSVWLCIEKSILYPLVYPPPGALQFLNATYCLLLTSVQAWCGLAWEAEDDKQVGSQIVCVVTHFV